MWKINEHLFIGESEDDSTFATHGGIGCGECFYFNYCAIKMSVRQNTDHCVWGKPYSIKYDEGDDSPPGYKEWKDK